MNWISVKERLPEQEGMYRVYVKAKITNSRYRDIGLFKNGKWYILDDSLGVFGWREIEATHWQPLPEPPISDE